MGLTALDLTVLILATWRLSHLLTAEAGPLDIFQHLRARLVSWRVFGCIFCLSVWVAAVLLAIHLWLTPLVSWWLALSGAALMLRAYTGVGMRDDAS